MYQSIKTYKDFMIFYNSEKYNFVAIPLQSSPVSDSHIENNIFEEANSLENIEKRINDLRWRGTQIQLKPGMKIGKQTSQGWVARTVKGIKEIKYRSNKTTSYRWLVTYEESKKESDYLYVNEYTVVDLKLFKKLNTLEEKKKKLEKEIEDLEKKLETKPVRTNTPKYPAPKA